MTIVFWVCFYHRDIVKREHGDGANQPYLLITTNTLSFQLSNRTLDLNKLLMLKEITKIQERKEFYLVTSSLYTNAEIVPVFQTVRDRHTLTVDSLKIGETGRQNSSGLYLLPKWCVFFFAAKDAKAMRFSVWAILTMLSISNLVKLHQNSNRSLNNLALHHLTLNPIKPLAAFFRLYF